MNARTFRWTALACCCLLLGACKDKHEPTKPTVFDAVTVVAALAP